MESRITSRRHPIVQRFRAAARGEIEGRIVVEGPRLVEEALRSGCRLEQVLLLDGQDQRELQAKLAIGDSEIFAVNRSVLEAATEVKSPQPGVALVQMPRFALDDLFPAARPALVLIACGIQQPGNLGAILRHGEAFGATGLIALEPSARLHRPAVLRGAMGSLFRLPAIEHAGGAELIEALRGRGLSLLALDAGGECGLQDAPLASPCALVLGSEAHGVPREWSDASDLRVRIPIAPPVESLGVAAASAVLLHQAFACRGVQQSRPQDGETR